MLMVVYESVQCVSCEYMCVYVCDTCMYCTCRMYLGMLVCLLRVQPYPGLILDSGRQQRDGIIL